MIEAQGAGYAVNGRSLVHDISLQLVPGRLTVVIGPNGAGKSTLFRLLTGELRPTSGNIAIGGQDARALSAHALSRVRAVVPQHTNLAFPFSVCEVVELGVTVPGLMGAGPKTQRLALAMLDRVGLQGLARRMYPSLSGGERQRVHIARALIQLEAVESNAALLGLPPPAPTLFVDEPTSSLDIAHQLVVLDELRTQAALGRPVLAVLHDLNLSAAHADEIVLLSEGRMLARGTPADVFTDALLSHAYGCDIRLNTAPRAGVPFLLPQVCGAKPSGRSAALRAAG